MNYSINKLSPLIMQGAKQSVVVVAAVVAVAVAVGVVRGLMEGEAEGGGGGGEALLCLSR